MARQQALSLQELDEIDSLWEAPGLRATLVSVFCAFGGWSLLLPVIPLAVIQHGGSDSLAGLSTGVFMAATVCTQACTPWAIRTLGFPPIMVFAALMLGLPALVYILDMSPVPLLLVAVLRGIGFGSVTVAEAALIAELVPPRLIGHSSAALGVSVGVSQLVGFPLGLWMYSTCGEGVVFAVAALYAVIGALCGAWIPSRRRGGQIGLSSSSSPSSSIDATASHSHGDSGINSRDSVDARSGIDEQNNAVTQGREDASAQSYTAATWKLAAVPGLAIGGIATGFAAFSTFLAPAAETIDVNVAGLISAAGLSVLGGCQMVGRVLAGRYASTTGEAGNLAVVGLVSGILGVVIAGAMIVAQPHGAMLCTLAFLATCVFGFGFGIVQNEALLMLFERLPRSKSTQASALWNMTFDTGTGLGAVLLGLVASALAYQGAFFSAALIIFVACAAVIGDRVVGKRRVMHARSAVQRIDIS
ncbi:MFS transporter [Corynebacterium anserum]|uniref:MFS transporter n=1 Tax=Corynebacterium anserum TaxID=2684406 RepID=A0A7G7YN23_9CORY|nr:MFS transporter [Corynebacterium anserum]MBC2680872.1 MFS transporter [Corynebacterium anserum]QNH95893.1 MFS transporter [Corynebacterium anserum]